MFGIFKKCLFPKFIYQMMEKSIKVELADEVFYLGCFEIAKQVIHKSEDVGSKELSNIINMILQNSGKMSKKKSNYILKHVSQRTVDEIEAQLSDVQKRLDFKLDDL